MGITQKPRKTEAARRIRYHWAPTILAVLATFLAALPTQGADVRLNRLSITQIELTGGTGRETWHLRYGTHATFYEAQLVPAEGDRAWFVHGNYLRLIDTKKGLVIGRWRFPYRIAKLTPQGTKVVVRIEEGREPGNHEVFGATLTFDPEAPQVPIWPPYSFVVFRLPRTEALAAWPSIDITGAPGAKKVPAEEAKTLLPEVEEEVRHDPLTPWIRVSLGKLLWDIGDARAGSVFREAIQLPSADFIDLLQISA